jgi:hypothetical protein
MTPGGRLGRLAAMRKRPVTIELGPWRFDQRPRVLIEHPDPEAGLEFATAFRRAGCTVAICRGPNASGPQPTRCPLHGLEPCAVVEGADVVVTALGFDLDESRAVLRGLRMRYPSTPLVVLVALADALALERELAGCTVLPQDAEQERVVGAVTAMLFMASGAAGS